MASGFPAIDPDEKVVLTFQFAEGLEPGEAIVSAALAVSLTNGADAASADHFGDPQISGTDARVPVVGCLAGVNYHLRVIAQTSNPEKALVIGWTLPCQMA